MLAFLCKEKKQKHFFIIGFSNFDELVMIYCFAERLDKKDAQKTKIPPTPE